MQYKKGQKNYVVKQAGAILLTVLLTVGLFFPGCALTGYAASKDDPGSKRLTGDIPASFYEGATFYQERTDAAANPFTGRVYTHNDRFDNVAIVNGIDISEHNVVTDWNQVKQAGIEYVILRAAYRGYGSAGTLVEDAKYQNYIKGALAAGLKVGLYIYSQAISVQEAQQEADFLYSKIGGYQIDLPLVLDYEFFSESGPTKGRLYDAQLSKEQMTAICNAFCERITAYGYFPMVYANSSMLNNRLNASEISKNYPIWLANYVNKTSYAGEYQMWQYASTGSVPGITGNVDMNFWYTNDTNQYICNMMVAPVPDMMYTGDPITPTVTVTSKTGVLTQGVDYTVSYENNVGVGTATIHIVGIGTYAGTNRNITFQIAENKVNDLKVTKQSKTAVSLKWSAAPGSSRYEVYCAEGINQKPKLVATLDANATTYQHGKRTAGKEYYYTVKAVLSDGVTVLQSEQVLARTIESSTRTVILKKAYSLRKTTASSKTVVKVPKKGEVRLIADTENKNGTAWYYVRYKKNGKYYYGYMPKSKGTMYRYGKTKKKKVNIRKGAGVNKKLVVVTGKKNSKLTILGEKKAKDKVIWYKVSYKSGKYTYTGYICSDYVKLY